MARLIQKLLFVITALTISLSFSSAKAETTECTQIVSLPSIITVQGIYCFKTNLVTSMTTGNAIEIQTNNVTIDMNGFKLGGALAGAGTGAIGIYALDRKNITIKNGNIRGFDSGIYLQGSSGSGHLIEQVRADGNTRIGFWVQGNNSIIRNNHVINTGSNLVNPSAYGIAATSYTNILIADNVISGVSGSTAAYGMHIGSGTRGEVRGNSVFEIKDATNNYGIYFFSTTGLNLRYNQINNTGISSTAGIIDNGGSTGVDCIENAVRGYTTAQSGCDYTQFNHFN